MWLGNPSGSRVLSDFMTSIGLMIIIYKNHTIYIYYLVVLNTYVTPTKDQPVEQKHARIGGPSTTMKLCRPDNILFHVDSKGIHTNYKFWVII